MPVYVALIRLDTELPLSGLDGLLSQLTAQEQRRARSISVAHQKQRYVLSHAAMHQIVKDEFGIDGLSRFETSPDGRPDFIGGPYVSLSRAENWAAVCFCRDWPVGVDVAINMPRDGEFYAHKYPGLKSRLRCVRGEDRSLQFLRAWTELESIAKLKASPLEALLTSPPATPACLLTFFDENLVVTISCETEQEIMLEWGCWGVDGVLKRLTAVLGTA